MKCCTKCLVEKDESDFRKQHRTCKQCMVAAHKYRRNNDPEFAARIKELRKAYRRTEKGRAYRARATMRKVKRNVELLQSIKTSSGCVDCGFNKHPVALQFDHVLGPRPKEWGRWASLSQTRILELVKLCVVRCANCHYIRHALEGKRFDWRITRA